MRLKHADYVLWLINKAYKLKKGHKNDFIVNYKCKIKNIPSKVSISNENVIIKQNGVFEEFKIKEIKHVKYRVRWWSVEVQIITKKHNYYCHFASIKQARKCYEYLIYQKIKQQH